MSDSSNGVIYRFISPSGKMYIGQSWNVERRYIEHKKYANRGHGPCRALCDAFGKYGFNSFIFEILESKVEDQKTLDNLESKYITELNTLSPNGYNLNHGGIGGKKSESAKKRMSLAAKERSKSKEFRDAMSKRFFELNSDPNWRGPINLKLKETFNKPEMKERISKAARERAKNPEWIQKMKEVQKKMNTPERRKAMSERSKNMWASEDGRKRQMEGIKKKMSKPGHKELLIANMKKFCIPVICIESGVRYESATEAARDIGFKNQARINQVCKGLRRTAGGYTWKFA